MRNRWFGWLLALVMVTALLTGTVVATSFAQTVTEEEQTVVTQQPAEQEAPAGEPAVDAGEGDAELLSEPEPVIDPDAEAIAAASAAIAALPDEITWDAFDAVEAAGAALAAVPTQRQSEVEGADKLTAAIDTLLQIYNEALAALDPTADVWENQQAIKAFAEMKKQMDAAQYVKPAADGGMSLMGDEAAQPDLSWLDAAMLAYESAEATIIPADGDLSLLDKYTGTDYNTLQNALKAVQDDDIVNVNRNITVTSTLEADNEATYTVNMNKKTLTFEGASLKINQGYVTINGTGTLHRASGDAPLLLVGENGVDTSLIVQSVTMTATHSTGGTSAIAVLDHVDYVEFIDCKMSGTRAIYVPHMKKYTTISVTDSILSAQTGISGQATPAITIDYATPDGDSFLLSNVVLTTDHPSMIVLNGDAQSDITVEVEYSELTTTATENVTPIQRSNDGIKVAVYDSFVSPAFSDTSIVGYRQTMFTTTSGDAVVTDTLSNALIYDAIELKQDYEHTGELTIGKNQALDIGSYALTADDITLDGTLIMDYTNPIDTPITVSDTGTLMIRKGDEMFDLYAPKVPDDAGYKPVFGIHKGGQMRLDRWYGDLAFEALQGVITIQHGYSSGELDDDDLQLNSEELTISEHATVWLAGDVGLYNGENITGVIRYVMATDAKGKINYETLEEALASTNSIKLVRDLWDGLAVDAPLVINKSVTIDLNDHRIMFLMSNDNPTGIQIDGANVNVTIKDGRISDDFRNITLQTRGTLLNVVGGAKLTLEDVWCDTDWMMVEPTTDSRTVHVGSGSVVTATGDGTFIEDANLAVEVDPGASFSATEGKIEGDVKVAGGSLSLESVNLYGTILPQINANISLNKCEVVRSCESAILLEGNDPGINISIKDSTLVQEDDYGNHQNLIYLPVVQSLSIEGGTLNAQYAAIETKAGNITLKDVSIKAGKISATSDYENGGGMNLGSDAIVAVVNNYSGTPGEAINLTIDGGRIESTNGAALALGYTSGSGVTKAQKPTNVQINGTTINAHADSGGIRLVGTSAPDPVQTGNLFAYPVIGAEKLSVAEGSRQHDCQYQTKRGTVVAKTLNDALAFESQMTVILTADYIHPEEDLLIESMDCLNLNGNALRLNTIASYGRFNANLNADEATIEANSFVAYGGDSQPDVMLASIKQLINGTKLELLPRYEFNRSRFTKLQIYDANLGYTNMAQNADDYWDVLFKLSGDAHMIFAPKVEGETAIDITAVAGDILIHGTGSGTITFDKHYLTILDGARVSVKDGVQLVENGHITGNILYADVIALEMAVSALPAFDEELTYEHYDLVQEAIRCRDAVVTNKHDNALSAGPWLKRVEDLTENDLYYHTYVKTAPASVLFAPEPVIALEIGGAKKAPIAAFGSAVPQQMQTFIQDNYELVYTLATGDATKFDLDSDALAGLGATQSAEPGDVATLSVHYSQKQTSPPNESGAMVASFRAVPAKGNAELAEIVLDSYSHTVNMQGKTQEITIGTQYAFNNLMRYEPEGYTISQDVTIMSFDNFKLSDLYTATYENNAVTLTLKPDAAPTKNKTYTGTLIFDVQKDGQPHLVPETALVSVKIVDALPKVTVKLGNLNVFWNKIDGSGGYSYEPISITLGGANAKDVIGVRVEDMNGISFDAVNGTEALRVTGTTKLEKGSIKPRVTLEFSDASGFDDYPVVNKKGESTVTLKMVTTEPAFKLSSTSGAVVGNAGDVVYTQLRPKNQQSLPFLREISGVTVNEMVGGVLQPSNKAQVEFQEMYGTSGTEALELKITLLDAISANTKLVLSIHYDDTDNTTDLPFTLTKKTLSMKLASSSISLYKQSPSRDYYAGKVGISINPASANVTLESVNGEEAYDGLAYVGDYAFICDDDNVLRVTLTNGRKPKEDRKFTLTFNETPGKTYALTVSAKPKYFTAKLAPSTVTVNTTLYDEDGDPMDFAYSMIQYSGGMLAKYMIEVDESSMPDSMEYDVIIEPDYGRDGLQVVLVQLRPTAGKQEVLTLKLNEYANVDPKKSTLKLTVKNNAKPIAMKASVQGKLDPLDKDSTVTLKLSFSGSAGLVDIKDFANLFPTSALVLTEQDVLEIKDYNVDEKGVGLLEVGWKQGANTAYGAGKYSVGLSLDRDFMPVGIALAKPVTIVAAERSIKPTVNAVTLHEATPYEVVPIQVDMGSAYTNSLITDVKLTKASKQYVVERTEDGFGIRYLSETPDFGKKWKQTDSVSLTISLNGTTKTYKLNLPITNVEQGV